MLKKNKIKDINQICIYITTMRVNQRSNRGYETVIL